MARGKTTVGWKFWKRKDKEYLDWLYRKAREGVNPSYKPPPTTVTGITCPRCGSDQIKGAGYGDRLECKKCGKVFG